MVLTRRASKSITRWLPNELISEPMLYLSQSALVALCKITSGLAIPLLYCDVWLSTLPEIENFLYALKRHADSPVPRKNHLRKFSLESRQLELSPNLVDGITALLGNLPNLRYLQLLLSHTQFPDTLRHSSFPNLSSFHCFVSQDTSALLSAFINRHQTITHLALYRNRNADGTTPALDSIHLPNLMGASTFTPSLVSDTKSLYIMHVEWSFDDLDVEGALAPLARMVAPWHILVVHSDYISEPLFLERLAASMPKVGIIAFCKISAVSGRIPLAHALEIATKLGRFSALASLEFLGFEDDGDESVTDFECEGNDIEIIESWAAACKTLVQVHLRERRFH
ncbi:hypothetical protein C8R44DRAFT_989064 [Mycena epipterygia]|nr:hypothetical protein C8R44DRAFT_989064 [Mycena epipterygia]